MKRALTCCIATLALAAVAHAGPENFHPGTAIEGFGNVASVADAVDIPADSVFKVAFDISKPAETGKANRAIESAARFINMHVEAGVPVEQIQLAIVVHGGAYADLLARDGNATAPLIAALVEKGVSFQLCGQTAAYYDVTSADLLPGVEMALSAMTAHAQLQQAGYTLNPF
jgi:intracellular sulfur oxidation DsrE/DsrF family protein